MTIEDRKEENKNTKRQEKSRTESKRRKARNKSLGISLIISIYLQGHGGQGRRHLLPELPGAAAEEVGLRLGEVHLLQDGDMLGHQAAQMGAKRKRLYNSSI